MVLQAKFSTNPEPAEDRRPAIWITVTELEVEDIDALKEELAEAVTAKLAGAGKVSKGLRATYKLERYGLSRG